MTLLLIAQLISSAPPLPPAQAAAVLHRSMPDLEFRPALAADGPTSIVIASKATDGPFGSFGPRPVTVPLNCCSVYRTRLPHPTVIVTESQPTRRGARR